MKRIFAFVLLLALLLTATACGGEPISSSLPDTPSSTTTTSGTENGTTTESAADSDTTTSVPTESTTGDTSASVTTTGNKTSQTTKVPANSTGSKTSQTTKVTTNSTGSKTTTHKPTTSTTLSTDPALNGVPLSSYAIVYNRELDYNARAAQYIRTEIKARTGIELEVYGDNHDKGTHEIVVGETNRAISGALDAKTEGVEFAIMAQDGHIALEGDYFVVAAAAYYFANTYISNKAGNKQIPEKASIHTPIMKSPKNFIFLIGDGMGVYQTRLFEKLSATEETDFSDGEDIFYGYLLPAMGHSRTNSLSGTTDSAAGGTALASGFKTINGYVGKDKKLNDVLSLTEIAGNLGMATAVMSTEASTGATPASFSAHAGSRNDSPVIRNTQKALQQRYGTTIYCDYDVYNKMSFTQVEFNLTDTLNTLSKDPEGFFLMYEEAHIDKHCHSNNIQKTFQAMVRFNQAIGLFMEFAFYNPDTFLLITADHETGGLHLNNSGNFVYSHGNHTSSNVPVFAYGMGSELFDGIVMENIQIPKTIAAFWGEAIEGTDYEQYPALQEAS